jgi:signal transduction histidine kinase
MDTKKIILVIDDDRKFALGLVAVLRREGYQVHHASNGVEGMSAIRNLKPDMILCDIMMPPPNGIQLKAELSQDPIFGQIPFIFLTARTAQVDKLIGLDSGADDYITKPFDIDELLARVQAVLRRYRRGSQTSMQANLADLEKLRGSISAVIGHEMHAPMDLILATLETILKEKFESDDAELQRYITTVNNNAYRIKFLIEDLEYLYSLSEGDLVYYDQQVDIEQNVRKPIENVLKGWEYKHLNVEISLDPDTIIFAPSDKFGHIVSHLVDNACKYTPVNGKIWITLHPNSVGGCFFEVTNEGESIPVELREKVFERYYQVHQQSTQEGGGLGLGLTIARAYARAWGGDVHIMDNPFGCRIRMVLPHMKLG